MLPCNTIPNTAITLLNYNLAPFNNFILAFKNIGNVKKDLKLIYTDKLFNVGKLEFAIRKQDIEHIPAIKS